MLQLKTIKACDGPSNSLIIYKTFELERVVEIKILKVF